MNKFVNNSGSNRFANTFTVFTATYNRVLTLPRVYESLKNQTFKDFVWIVGDDGSTDGTKELIAKWKRESQFPIRYFKQGHLGKNFVFNRGVREANGEYFVSVDSDNALLPEALEKLLFYWNQIPQTLRNDYYAVLTFCKDERGRLIGKYFKNSPFDCGIRKRCYTIGSYEMFPCFRTEILQQFPFDEDCRGYHQYESEIWFEIDKKYKARFVNDVVLIYYMDEPSLTRQPRHPMQNLRGVRRIILYTLNNDLEFFHHRPFRFLRHAWNFSRFSFHYKIGMLKQWYSLNNGFAKILWMATLPVSVLIYRLDILRNISPPDALKNNYS